MSFEVTFLGTGTSQGVPVIACDCKVCKSSDRKDARLRSSILISYQGTNLVVDTGPDFRQQMLRENVQHLEAVLFTHEHKDHTAGLDDVRAFNFVSKKAMDLYVNEGVEETLRREYAYVFSGANYPGIPQLKLNRFPKDKDQLTVKNVPLQLIHLMHYKLPVLGFRVNDFAYCTDTNYIAEEEKEKLLGLEVLVITALRIETHISHFNLSEALDLIKELKPKRAYLTHVSHYLGLQAEVSKELPPNVEIAYDGLKIKIP